MSDARWREMLWRARLRESFAPPDDFCARRCQRALRGARSAGATAAAESRRRRTRYYRLRAFRVRAVPQMPMLRLGLCTDVP